ncbi:MAG: hypothetical protein ACKO63_12965 [Nodosilinea sp.]
MDGVIGANPLESHESPLAAAFSPVLDRLLDGGPALHGVADGLAVVRQGGGVKATP